MLRLVREGAAKRFAVLTPGLTHIVVRQLHRLPLLYVCAKAVGWLECAQELTSQLCLDSCLLLIGILLKWACCLLPQ